MKRLLTLLLCSAIVFGSSTSDIAEAKKKTSSKAKSSVVKSSSSNAARSQSRGESFGSCKELNAKYPGGVALSAKVKNKGGKTKFKPFVSPELYNKYKKKMDRDDDGIACER
ncbi:excalibur calcium-binding domain-containing protein [Anoxybacillus ayderensis]|uniref:excalibur calcium-binding domain-containing protein n=1 Tax=Anoxybacillus ayderensis TaxID=265546 RepID=UPI00054DD388